MSAVLVDKPSDLGVRALSATVIIVVAGGAFAGGALPFSIFVGAVACWALWEWWALVERITAGLVGKAVWMIAGIGYVGGAAACLTIIGFAARPIAGVTLLSLIGVVVATDVGAYFAGRTIGGPKIAPSISPAKTWSGLLGGMATAAIFMAVVTAWTSESTAFALAIAASAGALLAIVAQAGDFFESWMKRRAGVKDAGILIPGHGGILDRIDGLIPVVIVGSCIALLAVGHPAT